MKKQTLSRIFILSLALLCLGLSAACTGVLKAFNATATATPIPTTTTPFPATFTPLPATETPLPTTPPTSTYTLAPSPTVSQTPIPTSTLPPAVEIEGIQGTYQTYELGCEANSAAQMARFFGIIINERQFQAALPLTDNPDTGFVGQVEGWWGAIPPASYGVHAEPVAAELRNFGLNAIAHRNFSSQNIREEIAAGRPVIVWVIGGVRSGQSTLYTAADGSIITVASYEHTVLVTGYGPDYFTFLDGTQVYQRSLRQFANSWQVLGNMAVTIDLPYLLPEPTS
jgi:uncharacterized protein YvpB